jgi:tetrahydromethanopterin S-methyltransferase subunit F
MPEKEVKKRKKPAAAKVATAKKSSSRTRKLTKKESKQKAKKEVKTRAPLPGSFALTRQTFAALKKYWKPLVGIVLVYALLNLVLASGIISNANSTVNSVKDKTTLSGAFTGFGNLFSGDSAGTSSIQSFLFLFETLVIIWALRRLLAGDRVSVKDAYFKSASPAVPFLILVFIIVLQLLPLLAVSSFLGLLISSNASATIGFIAGVIFLLVLAWTLYMMACSVIAIYIVTLPDVGPLRALKASKKLVHFRRAQLIRKILFLPLLIFFLMGLTIIPLIIIAHVLVAPVFFALTMAAILFAHTYLYNLYKGLLA